ncbi:MAG: hypothetical protein R6X10_03615 [Desulfobacterales bacterium]
MNIRALKTIIVVGSIFLLISCGEKSKPQGMTLSGTIGGQGILDYPDKPVLVAALKNGDFGSLSANPLSTIITLISVDKTDFSFWIDLSETGLSPGDKIYLIAFVDVNFTGSTPFPDSGDMIGFYSEPDSLNAAYTLSSGPNTDIHIDINREIFSFDSDVSGIVTGTETGTLILIAYAGEILSSDFSKLDINAGIGFQELSKNSDPIPFAFKILPYGYNIPIENVTLFALLDVNRNGRIDSGDRIGYYSRNNDGYPTPITVQEGTTENLSVTFYMDVHYPPEKNENPSDTEEVWLQGSFSMPDLYTREPAPLYIIITDADDSAGMLGDAALSVRYFERLPGGESFFRIDLSKTGLQPGDEVMIIGLWDRNNTGGFPKPDAGDYIGFYAGLESLSLAYVLQEGNNSVPTICVSREIFSFDSTVSGTVADNLTGDLTLIAYAGEILSSDFSKLDMDNIIGYANFNKENGPTPYELRIMPYGRDVPIETVYILALLDVNRNGKIDGGDKIGYHDPSGNGLPGTLTIIEGRISEIEINFYLEIPFPSGYHPSLQGEIDMPEEYGIDSPPVYIIIAADGNLETLLDYPLSGIRYFEQLQNGATSFTIDLSATDIQPDDNIRIIALWDRNFSGGFPNPDAGDMIGFYMNPENFSAFYTLKDGLNSGIRILANREISPFNIQISGAVKENIPGDLLIVAYAGEINSLDFTDFNPDGIIGYQERVKGRSELDYQLTILPCSPSLQKNHVYLMAFLDEENIGIPEPGNLIGFHTDSSGSMPELLNLNLNQDIQLTGIDIHMLFPDSSSERTIEIRIPEPSGDSIRVNGEFIEPDNFNPDEGSVFLLVARPDNPYEIFDAPLSSIQYFYKMPKGDNRFALDLSNTGLSLQDDVMIFALWDKNFQAGFPNPTPGDVTGFVQHKDRFLISIPLSEWNGLGNLPQGWDFSLNKQLYAHNAGIQFQIEGSVAVTPEVDDRIIVIAVERRGFDLLTQKINMDYIVGMNTITIGTNGPPYEMRILPAIYTDIEVAENPFGIDDIYLFAILDDNEANGRPDEGEYLGFYGFRIPFTQTYLPLTTDIDDEVKILEGPIRFSGDTY